MNNSFDPQNFDGKPSEYEQNTYKSSSSYQNNPHSQNTQTNPYQNTQTYQPQSPTATAPKKKNGSKVAFIACMLLLSTAFGFGGSVIADYVLPKEDNKLTSPSVITQSIVNTSDSANNKSDMSAIVDATENSVVEITTEVVETSYFMEQYVSEGAGSGVILSSDGYIITNNHVIEGATNITVTLKNGTKFPATLIGTDPESDIAVIKVDTTGLTPAVIGSYDEVDVGDVALAIGNPLGQLGGTVTEGIVSALDREITIDGAIMSLMQTSAAINPGNSGGGLFNDKGELIGIVNAKTSASGIEGLGFAIPIDTATKVAYELIEHGYVTGKIKMGVSFIDILDNQTAMQYRVDALGVYVYSVAEGSDAYKAGLESGDIIKSIDGVDIASSAQIKEMLADYKVGDVMEITLQRGGQQGTTKLTFTEYNPQ